MCSLNNLKKYRFIICILKTILGTALYYKHLPLTFIKVITFCDLDELMVFTENKSK